MRQKAGVGVEVFVVLLSLVLSVALGQVAVSQAPDLDAQRTGPRLRAGVSATGGAVMVRPGGWVPGFGVTGELGLILDDRISFSLRPQFFTNVGFFLLGGGAAVDYALGERFAFGLGGAVTYGGGLETGAFVNVFVPLRLTFAPFARGSAQVRRNGLLLGLELAPGALLGGSPGRFAPGPVRPDFSFSSMLTVGWAMW